MAHLVCPHGRVGVGDIHRCVWVWLLPKSLFLGAEIIHTVLADEHTEALLNTQHFFILKTVTKAPPALDVRPQQSFG